MSQTDISAIFLTRSPAYRSPCLKTPPAESRDPIQGWWTTAGHFCSFFFCSNRVIKIWNFQFFHGNNESLAPGFQLVKLLQVYASTSSRYLDSIVVLIRSSELDYYRKQEFFFSFLFWEREMIVCNYFRILPWGCDLISFRLLICEVYEWICCKKIILFLQVVCWIVLLVRQMYHQEIQQWIG